MDYLKYLIIFLAFFVLSYIVYYFYVVKPRVTKNKKSKQKEKKLPAELVFLIGYYKIDIKKIGLIRILRILNFVNALMFSVLVMVVYKIEEMWLKLIILAVIIIPVIWVTYYFLAKYLKYLEGKSEYV